MVVLAFLAAACSVTEKGPRLDPFAAINPFQRFDPLAPPSPLAAQVVAQWEADLAKPGFLDDPRWHTRAGRDRLTYQLILMSDYRFNRYESDLVTGRATRDTFVDVAVLGLSAAGTLINPGQATRILSAISGGLVASSASIEKNFYQNQAQAVLLRKMKVLRQEKLFSISHHLLREGVDRYPVERALIDVLDYYNRGTMLGALDAISQDTAAQEIAVQGGKVTPPPSAGASPTIVPLPASISSASVTLPPPSAPQPLNRPSPAPVHDRQKALIGQLPAMAESDAAKIAVACVPENFHAAARPKIRLQTFIRQTTDPDHLTVIEDCFPQGPSR